MGLNISYHLFLWASVTHNIKLVTCQGAVYRLYRQETKQFTKRFGYFQTQKKTSLYQKHEWGQFIQINDCVQNPIPFTMLSVFIALQNLRLGWFSYLSCPSKDEVGNNMPTMSETHTDEQAKEIAQHSSTCIADCAMHSPFTPL